MHDSYSFTLKNIFERDHFPSLFVAAVLLVTSFVANHFSSAYSLIFLERPTSMYVGDLILDNIPVIDLNFIIVEVALILIILGTPYILFRQSRYVLFSLKSIAIFNTVRALFISLTHVGIYPGYIEPSAGILDNIYMYFNMHTGFFFSGHTALPFLMALVFWNKPILRNIFLITSFVFAISVLLAHTHYSIDVLAAPFMAYGIFEITKYFFKTDYELTQHTEINHV